MAYDKFAAVDSSTLLFPPTVRANLAAVSPNYVINGAFDIWQRGTSFGSTGSPYTCDRWTLARSGGVTGATVSRQNSTLTAFQYQVRVQRDSGNTSTNTIFFTQSVETITSIPLQGKTVTFSFYAKSGANFSATSSALTATILSSTGTDQNFATVALTGQATVATSNVNLTSSWVRYSVTGVVAAGANQVHVQFSYAPVGTAGAADYFEVIGVQLEAGAVATPFRRNANSLQGELAACQRYYTRYSLPVGAILGVGHCYFTSGAYIGVHYPTEMRSTPASLDYSSLSYFNIYSGGINRVPTSIGLASGASSTKTALIGFAGATGFTAGYGAWLEANNASAYIGFSAEL